MKRNEKLKIIISEMKKRKDYNRKNNININKYKKYTFRNNKTISSSSFKEIYLKISNLYNLFLKNGSIKKEKNKKCNTPKEEAIYMLSYIEIQIDALKNKFRDFYNSDYINNDLMKKIKNNIERKHKIEKGEILRNIEKEKFLKFQEEIEDKMNRILFIQRRKTYIDYGLNALRKNKFNSSKTEKEGEPIFDDFMFDKNELINFESKI